MSAAAEKTRLRAPAVELFDIPFTSISPFVLLVSSLTMVPAHHAHTHRDMRRMGLWPLATVLQGRGRLRRRTAAG